MVRFLFGITSYKVFFYIGIMIIYIAFIMK